MNQWIYMYVCTVWIIWSGHVCYHDREQHLRRDDHRPQGRAVIEGAARYGHQGGGQRQAGKAFEESEGTVRYGHQGGGQRQAGQGFVV